VTLRSTVFMLMREALSSSMNVSWFQRMSKKIFDEAHTSKYSIHLGSTKMYHDLKAQFWWTRMKRKTVCYVSECEMCRRVKADHIRPFRLLQPLGIPA
jgi:hypothetical protein